MIIHELKHPTESISEMLSLFKKQLMVIHYDLKCMQDTCAHNRVPLLNIQTMLNEQQEKSDPENSAKMLRQQCTMALISILNQAIKPLAPYNYGGLNIISQTMQTTIDALSDSDILELKSQLQNKLSATLVDYENNNEHASNCLDQTTNL